MGTHPGVASERRSDLLFGAAMLSDVPKPPRISTLLPFPLTQHGGVSTFVAGLSEAVERRFGVRLILIAPDRFLGGPGRRVSQVVLAVRQFVRLCQVHPDVIHTHQHPALLASALAYRALVGQHLRIVHTIHVDPAEPSALWKRLILGWLLGQCTSVTAVSQQTARSLTRVATPVPRSVTIIYGATSVKPRRADDEQVLGFRKEFGLESATPILCQVGPLNFPLKVAGVERLIHALALVRRRLPNARLLLVGDGVLHAQVRRTAVDAGVADAVLITGYVDDVSIPLALADVYCHITLQDACPLSLIEAMRCGKAIVAARMGGMPEIISDGYDGMLVDPEPAEVAQAILEVLEEPTRAEELGHRAVETATERFTWDRAAAEFARLYGLPATQGDGRDASVGAAGQPVMLIQHMQESVYSAGFDYRRGSPHLSHERLYGRLLGQLRIALEPGHKNHDIDSVLEIGAGHGGFTEPMLAWGYRVTATEMSRASVAYLKRAFARNPAFAVVFDSDGSLSTLGDARFHFIVSVSVLHHIPDYRQAVRDAITKHLEEGGSFITFQDPLWYKSCGRTVRVVDNIAYHSWRLFQGRYLEGLRTRYRRLRGIYDETKTADMVEYHVVRQGVDSRAILQDLSGDFEQCSLLTYWSTQSGFWQRLGEMMGLENTFGVMASGYKPRHDGSATPGS